MKILLAIDGSKYSEGTVQALATQIRKENAEVLVAQVVEPRIYSTPPQMAPGYEPEFEKIMKELFEQAQQTAPHPFGPRVSKLTRVFLRPKRVREFWTWPRNGMPI